MNPNFVSVEALMNQEGEPDTPPTGVPVGGPVPGASPQKNNGNLQMGQPSMDGYITQLAGPNNERIFHCSITTVVEDCAPYYNLMKLLWTADEKDTIYIDIFSYGGQVETGCHIITAMQNTKAKVITRAYGLCCSIGAMIWAAGQVREVTPNATIMFHMPSGGVFGKTADNMEESSNIQNWFTEFMTKLTVGILTKEELDDIITCRHDFFIPASTMQQRLSALAGQASTEDLSGSILKSNRKPYVNQVSYEQIVDGDKKQIVNCGLCFGEPPKPRNLIFTREELPDNQIGWTFYLTEYVNDRMLRDFVHKMHLPAEQDKVLIHAPSELDMDTSEILSSAVMCCKGEVTISAPYVLNTPTAYFATSGDHLIPYQYGVMTMDLPVVTSYGKVIDTDNAIRIHKTRILHMLGTLRQRGFIQSEQEWLHIVKEQGTCCIFGDRLLEAIKKCNALKNDK